MQVDPTRLVRDPFHPQCVQLYAKSENAKIFAGRAEVWPLIQDLPMECHFGSLGKVEKGAAQMVFVSETSTHYTSDGDLRMEFPPVIVTPRENRRILRVAWATSAEVKLEPISVQRVMELGYNVPQINKWRGRKFPRLAPPGAPAQPICLRCVLPAHPIGHFRILVADWESV